MTKIIYTYISLTEATHRASANFRGKGKYRPYSVAKRWELACVKYVNSPNNPNYNCICSHCIIMYHFFLLYKNLNHLGMCTTYVDIFKRIFVALISEQELTKLCYFYIGYTESNICEWTLSFHYWLVFWTYPACLTAGLSIYKFSEQTMFSLVFPQRKENLSTYSHLCTCQIFAGRW